MGNVYAALVQHAASVQAACMQCAGSVAVLNLPNPPVPGTPKIHYFNVRCHIQRLLYVCLSDI